MFDRIGNIADRARNIRDATLSTFLTDYRGLHDQLTEIVIQARSTVDAININQHDLEAAQIAHLNAIRSGDQEQIDKSQKQLQALNTLIELQKDQDIEKIYERILNREAVDKEQAEMMISHLKNTFNNLDIASSVASASLGDVLEQYQTSLTDNRVSSQYRMESALELTDFINQFDLLKESPIAHELERFVTDNQTITESNSQELKEILNNLSDSVKQISDISTTSQELIDRDYISESELVNLTANLSDKESFKEQMTMLTDIIASGQIDEEENQELVKLVLEEIRDQADQINTQYTLQQLNKNFDQMILNQDQLETALRTNELETKFLENPELVSKGKGLASGALSTVFQSLGLGNLDAALGMSDFLVDRAADRFLGDANTPILEDIRTGIQRISGSVRETGRRGRDRLRRGRDRVRNVGGRFSSGARNLASRAGAGLSSLGSSVMDFFGDDLDHPPDRDRDRNRPPPRPPRSGIRGIADRARNVGGSLMGQTGGLAKLAGPAAGVLTTAMSMANLFTAESTGERLDSIGSGAGAAIGGILGSFIPIPGIGTMVGALAGEWLGGKIASWFGDPQDAVPDEVKKQGVFQEAAYVQHMIDSGEFKEQDLKELTQYRDKLLSKSSLSDYMESQFKASDIDKDTDKHELAMSVLNRSGIMLTYPDIYVKSKEQFDTLWPLSEQITTRSESKDISPSTEQPTYKEGDTYPVQYGDKNIVENRAVVSDQDYAANYRDDHASFAIPVSVANSSEKEKAKFLYETGDREYREAMDVIKSKQTVKTPSMYKKYKEGQIYKTGDREYTIVSDDKFNETLSQYTGQIINELPLSVVNGKEQLTNSLIQEINKLENQYISSERQQIENKEIIPTGFPTNVDNSLSVMSPLSEISTNTLEGINKIISQSSSEKAGNINQITKPISIDKSSTDTISSSVKAPTSKSDLRVLNSQIQGQPLPTVLDITSKVNTSGHGLISEIKSEPNYQVNTNINPNIEQDQTSGLSLGASLPTQLDNSAVEIMKETQVLEQPSGPPINIQTPAQKEQQSQQIVQPKTHIDDYGLALTNSMIYS